MMLRSLSILNFKNYFDAGFETDAWLNAFTGENGAGKTNILDAIHYLALCKSYFNPIDSQNILHDQPFFSIQGTFEIADQEVDISCSVKRGQRKIFRKNKKEYDRLADHVGLIPVVMVTPSDTDLILEGSETRRKFVDSVIVQHDRDYLETLIHYNKTLLQRNTLLKQFSESGRFDAESLGIWDFQLIRLGEIIFIKRKHFFDSFNPLFSSFYELISSGRESVNLEYDSDLSSGEPKEILEESLARDRAATYTTLGVHKDDLLFTLGGLPLKKTGSQGQQKSFLIALKLAQYKWLSQKKKIKPLLLLDDIYDKLDDQRVEKLMKVVSSDDFGQVFITDTSHSRMKHLSELTEKRMKIFEVADNLVNPGAFFKV